MGVSYFICHVSLECHQGFIATALMGMIQVCRRKFGLLIFGISTLVLGDREVMLSNNDVGRNHITICSKTYEPEPSTTQIAPNETHSLTLQTGQFSNSGCDTSTSRLVTI